MPRASWWGGFWEIMVKSVKRYLKKVLGNARPTFEEMDTILIEVEGVLNSRPLTYIHSELEEEPLTPSSLVCGKRLLSTPSESKVAAKSTLSDLTTRESYLKTLLNHFWSRWRREYLPSLREFHRNLSSSRNKSSSIKEGDIVYIQEDKSPRQNWKMGKVEKLMLGQDSVIRAAVVKTHDASDKLITLSRSIKHLYPIEVSAEIEEQLPEDSNRSENDNCDISIQYVADEDVKEHIK